MGDQGAFTLHWAGGSGGTNAAKGTAGEGRNPVAALLPLLFELVLHPG